MSVSNVNAPPIWYCPEAEVCVSVVDYEGKAYIIAKIAPKGDDGNLLTLGFSAVTVVGDATDGLLNIQLPPPWRDGTYDRGKIPPKFL